MMSPITVAMKLAVALAIEPSVPPVSAVPVSVTGPATTTARNALVTKAKPMPGRGRESGQQDRAREARERAAPSAKVIVLSRPVSIPIAAAVSRSCIAARAMMP